MTTLLNSQKPSLLLTVTPVKRSDSVLSCSRNWHRRRRKPRRRIFVYWLSVRERSEVALSQSLPRRLKLL